MSSQDRQTTFAKPLIVYCVQASGFFLFKFYEAAFPDMFPMVRGLLGLTRITASPTVMMGKPVVRGTRLTVEHILEELAGGLSIDDLVASHPRLTIEDVRAVLAFAAGSVRMERLASVQVAS